MNSTDPKIISFIVKSIALLSFICVASICTVAVSGVWVDGEVRGAIISLTGSLVGALTAMLMNTRSNQGDSTTTTRTATAISSESTHQPDVSAK